MTFIIGLRGNLMKLASRNIQSLQKSLELTQYILPLQLLISWEKTKLDRVGPKVGVKTATKTLSTWWGTYVLQPIELLWSVLLTWIISLWALTAINSSTLKSSSMRDPQIGVASIWRRSTTHRLLKSCYFCDFESHWSTVSTRRIVCTNYRTRISRLERGGKLSTLPRSSAKSCLDASLASKKSDSQFKMSLAGPNSLQVVLTKWVLGEISQGI